MYPWTIKSPAILISPPTDSPPATPRFPVKVTFAESNATVPALIFRIGLTPIILETTSCPVLTNPIAPVVRVDARIDDVNSCL